MVAVLGGERGGPLSEQLRGRTAGALWDALNDGAFGQMNRGLSAIMDDDAAWRAEHPAQAQAMDAVDLITMGGPGAAVGVVSRAGGHIGAGMASRAQRAGRTVRDAVAADSSVHESMAKRLRVSGYNIADGNDVRGLLERRAAKSDEWWNDDFLDAYLRAVGDSSDAGRAIDTSMRASAKRTFGVTRDTREAGYILDDGSLLDFSGKSDGGTPGMRNYDHREIGRAVGGGGSEGMIAFQSDSGAIRWMPESGGFDLERAPTRRQREMISRIARERDGEVIVDLNNSRGTGFSRQYQQGTRASEILRDIDEWFSK
jgi:hypothetical protein